MFATLSRYVCLISSGTLLRCYFHEQGYLEVCCTRLLDLTRDQNFQLDAKHRIEMSTTDCTTECGFVFAIEAGCN